MLADHPIFVVFLVVVAAPLVEQTRGGRLPVVVFEVGPIVAQALVGATLLWLLVLCNGRARCSPCRDAPSPRRRLRPGGAAPVPMPNRVHPPRRSDEGLETHPARLAP